MKEYGKYIVVSSIIGVSIIIGAFIMKPDRSAKQDCYYELKKDFSKTLSKASASRMAKDRCDIR